MILSKASYASIFLALVPVCACAQNGTQVGRLSCDVSTNIEFLIVQKQKLWCVFLQATVVGGENYMGVIDQFDAELGGVEAGHLIWGVIAATGVVRQGALAGKYVGFGANASFGTGAGPNVLVGGSERAFSLQPISVKGQIGVNIAGVVTAVTLAPAP